MALAQRKKRTVRTPEERWSEIFEDWRMSSLSAHAYCEKEGYSIDGFTMFYERQFGKIPESPIDQIESGPLFVPLRVAKPANREVANVQENSKIEIVFGNFVVRVQAGFDPVALGQILQVIGGM